MGEKVFRILLCLSILLIQPYSDSKASSSLIPPYPDTILVEMYELDSYGIQNGQLCNSLSTSFGCTAFCDDLTAACDLTIPPIPYPYLTNPIYAPIETYYLLDVVSQEMNPSMYKEPIALHAQAIAARSYMGWFLNNAPQNYDNSSYRQVFVPFKFDSLNPYVSPLEPTNSQPCSSTGLNESQIRACQAVSSHYYIAREYDNPYHLPAFSEFTADVYAQTQDHPELWRFSYLLGVEDPISTACDANDLGYNLAGMSQEGANRWARGHECSYPYAPVVPGNAPGGDWGVQWNTVEQILFHYYTGVHLIDEDGVIQSANYRWNPLQISGLPVVPDSGTTYNVTVNTQNVGTADYICNYPYIGYYFKYRWNKSGYNEVIGSSTVNLCNLAQGDSQSGTISLQVPAWGAGIYDLSFDIYAYTPYGSYSSFWFEDQNWPAYKLRMCVDIPCKTNMPFVAR